jgi:hypothetical protein
VFISIPSTTAILKNNPIPAGALPTVIPQTPISSTILVYDPRVNKLAGLVPVAYQALLTGGFANTNDGQRAFPPGLGLINTQRNFRRIGDEIFVCNNNTGTPNVVGRPNYNNNWGRSVQRLNFNNGAIIRGNFVGPTGKPAFGIILTGPGMNCKFTKRSNGQWVIDNDYLNSQNTTLMNNQPYSTILYNE